MNDQNTTGEKKVFDACPHCGHKLSPWQMVLLGVDRALTCKNCWYRIVLEVHTKEGTNEGPEEKKDS